MNPLLMLGFILFVAFLTEALTEYFLGEPFNHSPKLAPWKWLLQYISAGVGICLAFYYKLDLFYLFGQYVGAQTIPMGWPGIVFTGLSIGRGSNFIHDIWGKFFPKTVP
jgi:hypothetical protein